MKIYYKLTFGYFIIALLMGFVGYLSMIKFNEIKHKVRQLNESSILEVESSDKMLLALERCQVSALGLIGRMYGLKAPLADTKQTLDQTARDIKKNLDNFEQCLTVSIEATQTAIQIAADNRNRELEESEKEELEEWLYPLKEEFSLYRSLMMHFMDLAYRLPNEADDYLVKTIDSHYTNNILPLILSYREDADEEMREYAFEITEEYIPGANRIIIFSTILCLFMAFSAGFSISRSISKPIIRLKDAALEIGKGKLDTRVDIKTKDEVAILAQAFNRMTYDLSRVTVSKSYLDNIINSMLDTLIVINSEAMITMVNESTLNLLGYKRNELLGKPLRNIFVRGESEQILLIDELLLKGFVGNIEKTYLTKDGTKIPVLFSAAIMRDNRSIQAIVCAARDITERKRSDVALQKAHDELEQRIAERTEELLDLNKKLIVEIEERLLVEKELMESENRLRHLSSHILMEQEKERRRLALELHDEMGQSLSLLKVRLTTIQRKLRNEETSLVEAFDETRKYLNEIIENVRRISRDLSPSILEDLGLAAALARLISDFSKHFNIETSHDIKDVDNLFSGETQIIIYRIFQEALANIGKHAQATHVSIVVKKQDKMVLFLVKDNGKGFDVKEISARSPAEKGMGLAAMHERARMVGSSLKIWTQKGKGTQITFMVPITEGKDL
jgi:PAS domain S-box-containing protein